MSQQIDPRGPQFNAILTSVVLALTLLAAPSPLGIALLAVQALLFATGVVFGVQRTPAAYLFKRFVRPRLAAPTISRTRSRRASPRPSAWSSPWSGWPATSPAPRSSGPSPRASRSWQPCSTPSSGSAWAASCTC